MFNFDNFEWNITMLALHETVKVWPIWTGALTFMLTDDQLLDVIASLSTHPCQCVGQWDGDSINHWRQLSHLLSLRG